MNSFESEFDTRQLSYGTDGNKEYLAYISGDGTETRLVGDFIAESPDQYTGRMYAIYYNWRGSANAVDFTIYFDQTNFDVSDILREIDGGIENIFDFLSTFEVWIHGSPGNDVLVASNADGSMIWSMRGNDLMWSGTGETRFLFKKHEGKDKIYDFAPGSDQIDFTQFFGGNGTTAPNASQWKSIKKHSHTKNGDTIIKYSGGTKIVIDDVKFKELDKGDFIF